MSTPSKDKGDRAEVALVTYLQAWWPNVRRTKAGGEKDLGDLSGLTDRDGDVWAVQVADRNWRAFSEIEVKARETAQQAERLGAPCWVMICKRPGCKDPGRWWAWMEAGTLFDLIGTFNADGRTRGTWRSFAWSPGSSVLVQVPVSLWVQLTAPEAAA